MKTNQTLDDVDQDVSIYNTNNLQERKPSLKQNEPPPPATIQSDAPAGPPPGAASPVNKS